MRPSLIAAVPSTDLYYVHALLRICFVILLLANSSGIGFGQDGDVAKQSELPYRRVFLPLEELNQLDDLDLKYTTRSLDELSELLKPFQGTTDQHAILSRPPEILDAIYSARLVGPDLVSSRSLVRVSRGSLLSERLRLAPWGFALSASTDRTAAGNDSRLSPGGRRSEPQWGFDTSGAPLLKLHSDSVLAASSPIDFSFGWTLRSQLITGSTLRYQTAVPRCTNSCLLLALPPNTQVLRSNVPAMPIQDVNEIDRRLARIPVEVRPTFERTSLDPSSNSLWILELGGVDNLAFDLVTQGSNPESAAGVITKGSTFEHLIFEQLNEYRFIDEFLDCRGTFDVQWDTTSVEKTLRFRLEAPGKVRRLSAAGKDLDWSQQGEWIEVTGATVGAAAPPRASRISIIVEWSYRLEAWGQSPLFAATAVEGSSQPSVRRLPSLQMEKAFVFRGESQVLLGQNQKLASVIAPGCQYLESTTPNLLRFQWWDTPGVIQMETQTSLRAPSLRVLNKVMGSDGSAAFWARAIPANEAARRLFTQDLIVELEPGWGILDVIESESKRTIPWEVISKQDSPRVSIRLAQENLASLTGAIDIQLDPQESLAGEARTFRALSGNSQGWLRIGGASVEHWLVVENIPSYLTLTNLNQLTPVPLESLTTAERSFVITSEKSAVWRWNDNTFAIRERVRERPPKVRISSKLTVIDDTHAQVRHRLDWEVGNRKVKTVVRIPKQTLPWIVSRTVPSQPSTTPVNKGSEEWFEAIPADLGEECFSFRIGPDTSTLSLVFENQISLAQESFSLPLPIFEEGIRVQHALELSDGFEIVDGIGTEDAWQVDVEGRLVGERKDYSKPVSVRRVSLNNKVTTEMIRLDCHHFLDHDGRRRVVAQIALPPSAPEELEFTIESGWSLDPHSFRWITEARDRWVDADPSKKSFRIRTSRVRLGEDGGLETEGLYTEVLEFTADGLNETSLGMSLRERWNGFTVRAPEISLVGERLKGTVHFWLPLQSTLSPRAVDSTKEFDLWDPRTGFRWWKESIALLSGSDLAAKPITQLAVEDASLQSNRLDTFADWKLVSTLDQGLGDSSLEARSVSLIDLRSTRAVQGFAMLIFMLLPILFRRASAYLQVLIYIAGLGGSIAFAGSIWEGERLVGCVFTGLFIGLLTTALLVAFQKKRSRESKSSRATLSTWEGSHASRELKATHPIKTILPILLTLTLASKAAAQGEVYIPLGAGTDILFPIDSNGEVLKDSIYVPNQLLSALRGTPSSDYLLYSARYQWKVNFRNRPTAIPDQITMVYDLWIGKSGVPLQFPVATAQATLIRFVVDDQDVVRFQHKPDGIEWIPERAGRRLVQLTLSPKWSTQETQGSNSNRSDAATIQTFEFGLLPCPNAFVEIESLDPAIQIDVDSFGGITNPSPGRYLVALGGKPSLRGSARYQQLSSLTVPPPSTTTSPPVLNIELFLQNSNVRAKTVLRVPEGATWERTFEMEADDPWQPIGNRWGGVTLIDTKPASTFSRRRYVFQVDNEVLVQSQFDMPILWGLRDKSLQALNVLFAECVDRRVRPSTLRYARFPGSEWNLEQVSSWIPAINERERLDWPELPAGSNPRASSLRFPPSGGFGALKRMPVAQSMQARVSTRWILNPDSQTIQVRLDTLGTTNADSLELVLPRGFVVTEANHRNRLGALQIVQNLSDVSSGNRPNKVQLFTERQLTENYEIELRAEKKNGGSEFEAPWVSSPTIAISEQSQSIDVAASELCSLIITSPDGSIRSYVGKGASNPIAMIAGTDRVLVTQRQRLRTTDIRWEIEPSGTGDRIDVILRGRNVVSLETRSKLTIELPTGAYENVRCDKPLVQIPSPISDFSWWQIDLSNADPSEQTMDWSLQLTLTESQLEAFVAGPDRFRMLDEPDVSFPTAMVKDWLSQHQASKSELQQPGLNSSDDRSRRREFVAAWNPTALAGEQRQTKIDYWIFGVEHSHEFELSGDSQLLGVTVNGKVVAWERTGDTVHLHPPILPHGLPALLAFSIAEQEIDEDNLPVLPKHRDAPSFLSADERLSETFDVLESTMDWIPETMQEGSFAHKWLLDLIKVAVEPNLEISKKTRSNEDLQEVATRLDGLLRVAETRWPQLRWQAFEFLAVESNPVQSSESDVEEFENPVLISYWMGSLLLIASVFILGLLWRDDPEKLLGWLSGIAWLATGLWILAGLLLAACLVTVLDNILIRRSSPLPRRSSKSRVTNL